MRTKLMRLAAACALTAAPSLAFAAQGTLRAYENSYYGNSYVNPDGTYPSFWAFDRELQGTPCGIQCRHDLAQERMAEMRHHSRW